MTRNSANTQFLNRPESEQEFVNKAVEPECSGKNGYCARWVPVSVFIDPFWSYN